MTKNPKERANDIIENACLGEMFANNVGGSFGYVISAELRKDIEGAIQEAINAERIRCAQIAETLGRSMNSMTQISVAAAIAYRIRSGKEA